MEKIERYEPAIRQRTVRRLIVVFVVLMTVLTLMSNTIYNYSLPRVTLVRPSPGLLTHQVTSNGTIQAAEIFELYLDTNWVVDQVLVKEGDKVTSGQTLVTFRIEDATYELMDEQARYEQRKLSLEKLKHAYIQSLKNDEEFQRLSLELDIESMKLDLEIQERKIEKMKKRLDNGGKLISTVTGTVSEVHAKEGFPVTAGLPIVRLLNEEKGYQFVTSITAEQVPYIHVGGKANIRIPALNNEVLGGTISEIRNPVVEADQSQSGSSVRMELVVDVKDERLREGEWGELFVSIQSEPLISLIANSAIQEDAQGKFVWVLKEKDGPLGQEYYVQRAQVTIGDSDDRMSNIVNGLGPADFVILASSKPITAGDRVKIAD